MRQIVECVPNFSEGRNRGVIDQVTAEIKAVDGTYLLDVDPGAEGVAPFEGQERIAHRARDTVQEIALRPHRAADQPRHGFSARGGDQQGTRDRQPEMELCGQLRLRVTAP